MSDSNRTYSPSDEALVAALRTLRVSEPGLAAAKVLVRLKEGNQTWSLSEKRLKKIMNISGLGTQTQSSTFEAGRMGVREEAHALKLQPLQLFTHGAHLGRFDWTRLDGRIGFEWDREYMKRSHSDALSHQLDYLTNSDRYYRICGRGATDWGVTFNSDRAIYFNTVRLRFMKERRPGDLYEMYLCLLRAARNAGVSAADLRSQMHAEYGMDPLLAAGRPYQSREEGRLAEERDKAVYCTGTLELMQKLVESVPAAKQYVSVDADGRAIWREEKNGLDTVFSVPVPKFGDSWRMTDALQQSYENAIASLQ